MYMDYKSDTIANIIDRLNAQYFLPAIQREFVWEQAQIIKLFDSIMQNYPIGAFLFWQLKPENYSRWDVYKFIQDHKEYQHNDVANTSSIRDLTMVLDGQQRLTALNIGLRGSDTRRRKYMRWDNPRAYVKKTLYLDLLKDPKLDDDDTEADIRYGFEFFDVSAPPKNSKDHYWFPAGRVLGFSDEHEFLEFRMHEREKLHEETTMKQAFLFEQNLQRLYHSICQDHFISYYTEKLQDYDRVLTIFVRANQGGTPLTMSDLLLSTITAKWSGTNARDEIYNFVDHLNNDLSRKNNFSKDFVMKNSLALSDLPVQYKVENFNNQNLEMIQSNWPRIKASIQATVNLINSFGIDRDTLTSVNALIPIAYYFMQHPGFTLSTNSDFDVRNATRMRRWLLSVLLNESFGGASDSILTEIRRTLQDQLTSAKDFPVEAVNAAIARRGSRRAYFDEDAIKEFLENRYGKRTTFLALSLLYEDTWQNKREHQDHIFPRALFNRENLEDAGIPSDKQGSFYYYMDSIANLQLLSSAENLEKLAKPFDQWITTRHSSYKAQHLIPDDPDLYSLDRFLQFVNAREQLIRHRINDLALVSVS